MATGGTGGPQLTRQEAFAPSRAPSQVSSQVPSSSPVSSYGEATSAGRERGPLGVRRRLGALRQNLALRFPSVWSTYDVVACSGNSLHNPLPSLSPPPSLNPLSPPPSLNPLSPLANGSPADALLRSPNSNTGADSDSAFSPEMPLFPEPLPRRSRHLLPAVEEQCRPSTDTARTQCRPSMNTVQPQYGQSTGTAQVPAEAEDVLMVYRAMGVAASSAQPPATAPRIGFTKNRSQGAEGTSTSGGRRKPFSETLSNHSSRVSRPTQAGTQPGTQPGIQAALLRRVLSETGVSAEALEAGACACLRRLPGYARAQPLVLVASLWALEALQSLHALDPPSSPGEGCCCPCASQGSPGHTPTPTPTPPTSHPQPQTPHRTPPRGGPAVEAGAEAGPGAGFRDGSLVGCGPAQGVPGGKRGAGGGGQRCRYQGLCQRQLEEAVELRFDSLLGEGRMGARVGGGQLVAHLREALALSRDLGFIRDAIGRTHPSAFQALLRLYTCCFVEASLGLSETVTAGKAVTAGGAPGLCSSEIREVLTWAEELSIRLATAGAPEALARAHIDHGALDPLMDAYVARLGSRLEGCFFQQVRLFLEAWAEGGAPGSGAPQEDPWWGLSLACGSSAPDRVGEGERKGEGQGQGQGQGRQGEGDQEGGGREEGEGDGEGDLKALFADVHVGREVFRVAYEELWAAEATGCAELTRRVAGALWEALGGLQEQLLGAAAGNNPAPGTPGHHPSSGTPGGAAPPVVVKGGRGTLRLGPRGLVALANASVYCMRASRELEEDVEAWLAAPGMSKGLGQGQGCGSGPPAFDLVAKEVTRLLAKQAFEARGVRDRLAALYSASWHSGPAPTQGLLSALLALLWGWEPRMLGAALGYAAGACLERLVLVYVERLVCRRQPLGDIAVVFPELWVGGFSLGETTVDRLFEDVRLIREAFEPLLGDLGCWDRVRVLAVLGNLASARSVESFVRTYREMLGGAWPECSPRLVHRIAALLPDVNREARQRIAAQCEEVWRAFSQLPAAGQGPPDRDPSFARVGELGLPSWC